MESQMLPLVQIEFGHGYFNDRLCTRLSVRPADATLRTLTNHGLWWKPGPGGLTLLYDARHGIDPRIAASRARATVLNSKIALRFLLRLEDPYFYNYTTSPPPLPGRQVLCFFNRPGSSLLSAGPQVSATDFVSASRIPHCHLTDRPFELPFAILGLRLRPDLPALYRIEFQPRSAKWQYILVGDHLQDLQNPAVIMTNNSTQKIFSEPSGVRLTDGRTGLAFLSPEPIDCSERPDGTYMLVEEFDRATGRHKVVLPNLPVPDTRMISRGVAEDNRNNYTEIFIY